MMRTKRDLTHMARLLQQHGVEHVMQEDNLYALDVRTIYAPPKTRVRSTWINVSNWPSLKLMRWLGY
jgi:hypothetical protein